MTAIADRPTTIFRRPTAETGFWSWVTSVDHKKIGIMYGYTAFIFFIDVFCCDGWFAREQHARPPALSSNFAVLEHSAHRPG